MVQGAAAGASAGAPFGIWGVVIGAVVGAALGAADDANAEPMADLGQNGAAQMGSDFIFDNSGWNINFRNGTIDARGDKTTSTGAKSASATQEMGQRYGAKAEPMDTNIVYAGIGAAGFLVSLWIVKRYKKHK